MLLYKYCPPERVDVLQSGLIAYTEPLVFNDPFEFELILSNPSPENVALAKARDLAADNAERSRLDRQIERLQDLEGQVRLTLEQAARSVGILSLSKTPDNLLMWAHYAKNHTGFLLGIDTADEAWLEQQRRLGRPEEPRQMKYASVRPSHARLTEITQDDIWFTKSEEWRYEQEWRVTRWLQRAARILELPDGPIHLFELPASAIREVILGCRASESLGFKVNQTVFFDRPCPNVKVLEAELDPRHYRLNILRP